MTHSREKLGLALGIAGVLGDRLNSILLLVVFQGGSYVVFGLIAIAFLTAPRTPAPAPDASPVPAPDAGYGPA